MLRRMVWNSIVKEGKDFTERSFGLPRKIITTMERVSPTPIVVEPPPPRVIEREYNPPVIRKMDYEPNNQILKPQNMSKK